MDKSIPNAPPEKTADDQSILEQAQRMSLKAAGYLYLVGDAALYASGRMSGRNKEAAAGLIYSIGGVAPALFANDSTEHKLQQLYRKLGHHLQQNGAVLPSDSPVTTATLASSGGVLETAQDFLYRYPSQILNAVYAVGGTQLLRSGLQHHKRGDAAAGALVTAGGLAGLLIPEEPPEETGKPPANFFESPWQWMKEKPLRVSGLLYQANNVMLGASVFDEYRRAQPGDHSWVAKLGTVGCYFLANTLLTMSSKDYALENEQGRPDREAMEALESVSAHIVAAQPPERQAAIIQEISGYLSGQSEVKIHAGDLAKAIEERVRTLTAPPAPTPKISAVASVQPYQPMVASPNLPA